MATKKPKKADLEARIAALPDKRNHNWTPEIDRLILTYVPLKGTPAVAAILGIPRPTVEGRFRKLKAEQA